MHVADSPLRRHSRAARPTTFIYDATADDVDDTSSDANPAGLQHEADEESQGFSAEQEDSEDSVDDLELLQRHLDRKAAHHAALPSSAHIAHSRQFWEHNARDALQTSDDGGYRVQGKSKKRKRGDEDHYSSELDFVVPDDWPEDELTERLKTSLRQSKRSTRHIGAMKEKPVDDIYRSESDHGEHNWRDSAGPRATSSREVFQNVCPDSEFVRLHIKHCDSCGLDTGLECDYVFCQGCNFAYHRDCIAQKAGRTHLVTKIGDRNCVLQCKYCIDHGRKNDSTAPHLGKCQQCHELPTTSKPFNSAPDSIDKSGINNAENLLFRCTSCQRAWHYDHLPLHFLASDEYGSILHYRELWKCIECSRFRPKIVKLIAWRPQDRVNFTSDTSYEIVEKDEIEYLVLFDGTSYRSAKWMPGTWVWNTSTTMTRKAFAKNPEVQEPKLRMEDAIPAEYLLADVVLDVEYRTLGPKKRTPDFDKARVNEVSRAYIKYQGLSYDDAVMEAPPDKDDEPQWSAFVKAYEDWVDGFYLHVPTMSQISYGIGQLRHKPDELRKQSSLITGGALMDYQADGVLWLLRKWFANENAILGDEMGLGKTFQIIAFLAKLVECVNCFPFLIVVPNSTCQNWRREVKRWAPSLRVSTYYGSKLSRDLVEKYELFSGHNKQLHCHIVITSYEAAAAEETRKVFRSVPWQGLVVDEGQRLKNDASNLYSALQALRISFRVLLTGTPLQNNQRELFNLLQFLNTQHNAAQLERRYQDLDEKKIKELHDMIRPYFLRRTKRQVLTFLPPMQQVVLPISMTPLQKKVYRTILTKNSELLRAILGGYSIGKSGATNLNNILMQLRKCLCHPFVYNQDIEERTVDHDTSIRNLIDASGKLKLLEQMLPKLQAAGHRVLIFSQFLDWLTIVEDFLTAMGMGYQRLDGSIGSLEKQKRIDSFNAAGSPLFAFLLSTRAGGVGINLATADTVIILDPDFNPHQDIQALSRAHRIGQVKPVLCFRLVTIASAEERILAIGRKKLALEKALIGHIDNKVEDQSDLISVLRHGVAEIFKDDTDRDIVYDDARMDELLDRSTMPALDSAEVSAEDEWSFAEVWKMSGTLSAKDTGSDAQLIDLNSWDKILQQREEAAAKASAKKAKAFGRGRGRRSTAAVSYTGFKALEGIEGIGAADIPLSSTPVKTANESDKEFNVSDEGGESDKDQTKKAERKRASRTVNGKQLHSLPALAASTFRSGTRGRAVAVVFAQSRIGRARKNQDSSAAVSQRGRPRKVKTGPA